MSNVVVVADWLKRRREEEAEQARLDLPLYDGMDQAAYEQWLAEQASDNDDRR